MSSYNHNKKRKSEDTSGGAFAASQQQQQQSPPLQRPLRRIKSAKPNNSSSAVSPYEQTCRARLYQETKSLQSDLQRLAADRSVIKPPLPPPGSTIVPPVFHRDLVCEVSRRLQEAHSMYGTTPSHSNTAVLSCGDNDMSQLGLLRLMGHGNEDDEEIENESSLQPELVTALPALRDWKQVTCGGAHSIVLQSQGKPYTWGMGDEGILGRLPAPAAFGAPPVDPQMDQAKPAPVTGMRNAQGECEDDLIQKGVAGNAHCLLLSLTGHVYYSGFYNDMDSGKFHPSDTPQDCKGSTPTPICMSSLFQDRRVLNVWSASGANFGVALLDNDELVTWGFGTKGELARSATMTHQEPDGSYDLGKAFFYTEDGPDLEKVHRHFLTPQPVIWSGPQVKRTVVSVACGSYHLLVAARNAGRPESHLYASGLNQYGQLGLGDLTDRHALTLVSTLKDENIAQMACGEHHSLALSLDGYSLFAFGRADYGQLGLREFTEGGALVQTPERVRFPAVAGTKLRRQRITKIAAGDRHSMAITSQAKVYTWGFGETGPTGHVTQDGQDVQVPVLLDLDHLQHDDNDQHAIHTKTLQVAGGGQHSLFLVERFRKE